MSDKKNLLLSTDTLSGCGLDFIFEIATKSGFDGIDLAIWKNFDSWNVPYVQSLVKRHNLPVKVIQTSATLNKREMEKALDLCEALGVDTININAPKYFDYKSFNFIKDNIESYRTANHDIVFSIINPVDSNFFMLPIIPKYRFSNIVGIVKEYGCNLGLDISNLDEESFEHDFMKKMSDFLPYISTTYLSDRSKDGTSHLMLGDGIFKLSSFLNKLSEGKYNRFLSIKCNISKSDLIDAEKIQLLLEKMVKFVHDYFN